MADVAATVPDRFDVHLVDGTFELFRCFHGAPRARNRSDREVGATRAFLATLVSLLGRPGVTHVAVAFDSIVPPRGVPGRSAEELIAAQTAIAADVVRALGLHVWPTGRYQADEIIATAAHRYAGDPAVGRVVICSNDKDFHQCVRDDRVVTWDRIRDVVTDEGAARDRYGVAPEQLPDLFALVGDPSDGLPGVPGWGPATSAALLRTFSTVDAIPLDPRRWPDGVRGAARLAAGLGERRDEVLLCRDLAELRTDLPLRHDAPDLVWAGAHRERVDRLCELLDDRSAADRIESWNEVDDPGPTG